MIEDVMAAWHMRRSAVDLWTRAARIMLVFLFVIISIAPVTQRLWSGDNMFTGHGDTESAIALGLTYLSLSLLLIQCSRREVEERLTRVAVFLTAGFRIWNRQKIAEPSRWMFTEAVRSRERRCDFDGFKLPLLI